MVYKRIPDLLEQFPQNSDWSLWRFEEPPWVNYVDIEL
jgi:hypothetical protein